MEVAFKLLDSGITLPMEFKKISCYLIFDVKFSLSRKARYIGEGHHIYVSLSMSYLSVVSRDSARIILLVAALNDIDVKMCDIGNVYLNVEMRNCYGS